MNATTKRHTAQIAQEPITQPASAFCSICGCNRWTFTDRQGKMYFTRHQQAGRGNYCDNSGKKVEKA